MSRMQRGPEMWNSPPPRRTHERGRRRRPRPRRTTRQVRGFVWAILLLIVVMWFFHGAHASYAFDDLMSVLHVHNRLAYTRLMVLCLAVTLIVLLVRIWRKPPPPPEE